VSFSFSTLPFCDPGNSPLNCVVVLLPQFI
jgi:hypothetical protein